MKKLPAIPLIRMLQKYAEAKGLQFKPTSWKSITATLKHYEKEAQNLK